MCSFLVAVERTSWVYPQPLSIYTDALSGQAVGAVKVRCTACMLFQRGFADTATNR